MPPIEPNSDILDIEVIPPAGEEETWISVEGEDGTSEEYLVDDVLEIEYNGVTADYAVLIARGEVEKADADPDHDVEDVIIAKLMPAADPIKPHERDLLPLADEAEAEYIFGVIAELYEEEAAELEGDGTKEPATTDTPTV